MTKDANHDGEKGKHLPKKSKAGILQPYQLNLDSSYTGFGIGRSGKGVPDSNPATLRTQESIEDGSIPQIDDTNWKTQKVVEETEQKTQLKIKEPEKRIAPGTGGPEKKNKVAKDSFESKNRPINSNLKNNNQPVNEVLEKKTKVLKGEPESKTQPASHELKKQIRPSSADEASKIKHDQINEELEKRKTRTHEVAKYLAERKYSIESSCSSYMNESTHSNIHSTSEEQKDENLTSKPQFFASYENNYIQNNNMTHSTNADQSMSPLAEYREFLRIEAANELRNLEREVVTGPTLEHSPETFSAVDYLLAAVYHIERAERNYENYVHTQSRRTHVESRRKKKSPTQRSYLEPVGSATGDQYPLSEANIAFSDQISQNRRYMSRGGQDEQEQYSDSDAENYNDIDSSIFNYDKSAKAFFCPFPDCLKSFPSLSRVKRHYMAHTGIKPYKCPNAGCGKRFGRKDNMQQHYKNHCKTTKDQKEQSAQQVKEDTQLKRVIKATKRMPSQAKSIQKKKLDEPENAPNASIVPNLYKAKEGDETDNFTEKRKSPDLDDSAQENE